MLIPCLVSATVSISLKLDRSEATPLDSIRMVVSLSGARKSASPPALRGLELFKVTSGGTSSRLEIINGKVNAGIDYTYYLQPKNTGTFKIGPAEVTVKGKTYKSNTARLNISKPSEATGTDQGPIFLSTGLASKELYVEGQTIYTLKLYSQANVKDISLNLPELEHVSLTQLGKPAEYQSVYGGRPYKVLEVRYALVPSREGKYMIGPLTMKLTVLQPGGRSPRGLFDDRFFPFSTGRPMTLAGKALELNVLPLPTEGRPVDYNGLVGTFQIESKLEPSTVKAGESATLTVILSGRGNIKHTPDLKFPDLARTKVYKDQPALEVKQDAKGLGGAKTMKWALVPEKEGRLEIPPLSVGFFDTGAKQYRVLKTSPHSLSVLPGKEEQVQVSKDPAGGASGAETPAKETVKEIGRDILPIHTSIKDLTSILTVRPEGIFFWLVFSTPFFLYMLALSAIKFRRQSVQTLAATKAKKAARDFIRKCNKGGISSNDLILSIRDYLNNRFALSLGALTPDEAARILESEGVRPDTAHTLQAILQRLEDAVYTGKGQESCTSVEDIPGLITEIEKEIR